MPCSAGTNSRRIVPAAAASGLTKEQQEDLVLDLLTVVRLQ
jgi:hypothetical protein